MTEWLVRRDEGAGGGVGVVVAAGAMIDRVPLTPRRPALEPEELRHTVQK